MKQTGDISLIKEDQKKFTKKTQKLKQKIKDGKVVIRQKPRLRRRKISKPGGLIYIGHLPHGFYEDEIKAYFSQFGRVLNVKVCRSRRTGNSKGYGFVEFEHEDVAKIAAETMNNYLMFKKKLIANFIPHDKRPPHIFHSVQSTFDDYSTLRRRRRLIALEFKETDNDTHLKQCKAKLKKLGKRLKKLKELGINHEVQPVDVPEGLEIKKIE